MSNIVVYSKVNCPYCSRAKQALREGGYNYTEVIIEIDITRSEFLNLFPEARTAPYILVNGDPIGGYTELTEWIQHDRRAFLSEGSH